MADGKKKWSRNNQPVDAHAIDALWWLLDSSLPRSTFCGTVCGVRFAHANHAAHRVRLRAYGNVGHYGLIRRFVHILLCRTIVGLLSISCMHPTVEKPGSIEWDM